MSGEIKQVIDDLCMRGWSPKQISDYLDLEFDSAEVPLPRTVQRMVSEFARDDSSGDWSFLSAPAEECCLVLPVLKAVAVKSAGRTMTISNDVAKAIAKTRKVAGELDPWDAYDFTIRYLKATEAGKSTVEFDLALAYKIWDGRDAATSFFKVVDYFPDALTLFRGTEKSAELAVAASNHHAERASAILKKRGASE